MKRCVLAAVLAASTAHGQVRFLEESFSYDKAHPAAGTWLGNVRPGKFPDTCAQLVITRDHEGDWSAAITIATAGALGAACDPLDVSASSIAFAVPSAAGGPRFEGTLSADGQRISGAITFPDSPDKGTFELARTPRPMDLARPLAFTGFLESPQIGRIELVLAFAETPGGNWVGHADVPAQALVGFPLINVTNEDGAVRATLPVPVPAVVEARIEEDDRRLVGRFRQGPFDLELRLARNDLYVGPILRRSQHPKPPFPYEVREVRAEHPAGHVLAGTLTMPQGAGPFPAAILISGSGPQDRDEQIFGHRPFLVIADYLTRNGIAVLRYDDRGTAQSTGSFAGATTDDFATDVLAVLRFAESVERIDRSKIGLIGHSEGGLIAPIVAGLAADDVAFIVLLAGPGVSGDELLRLQGKLILEASGADEAFVATIGRQQEQFFELMLGGASEEELRAALRPVLEAQLAAATGAEGEVLEDVIEMQMTQLASPWMRYFITYDPRPALSRLRCPVLAVNGTLDLQVWHDQNLPAIQAAMADGGDLTVKRYDKLNHLFQPAHTGSLMEYGVIETTFDEAVLRDIVRWIDRKMQRRAP